MWQHFYGHSGVNGGKRIVGICEAQVTDSFRDEIFDHRVPSNHSNATLADVVVPVFQFVKAQLFGKDAVV